MKGVNLVGLRYQAIFPAGLESEKTIYRVIPADFVSTEDGSGIVHIAPAFGAEDMQVIKKENQKLKASHQPEFPLILNVDENGAFSLSVSKWAGMFVKDADPLIIEEIKKRGLLFAAPSL